jgi:hypothetical protein
MVASFNHSLLFKSFPKDWWCRKTPFWVGLLLVIHSKQQWCCYKLQVARQQQLQEAA